MRAQATYKVYQSVLPFVRKNADAVHISLEAARSASAASEAWEQAPGLGAALTAAQALQVLKGGLCYCCSAQCFPNQHCSRAQTCLSSKFTEPEALVHVALPAG